MPQILRAQFKLAEPMLRSAESGAGSETKLRRHIPHQSMEYLKAMSVYWMFLS